jgi:hypothetical protein
VVHVGGFDREQVLLLRGEENEVVPQSVTMVTNLLTDVSLSAMVIEALKQGSRLETLCGDNIHSHPSASRWTLVWSPLAGDGRTKVIGPRDWPEDDIRSLAKEGYRITSVAGSPGHWVVVLRNDTGLGDQTWTVSQEFPSAWIEETWKDAPEIAE